MDSNEGRLLGRGTVPTRPGKCSIVEESLVLRRGRLPEYAAPLMAESAVILAHVFEGV